MKFLKFYFLGTLTWKSNFKRSPLKCLVFKSSLNSLWEKGSHWTIEASNTPNLMRRICKLLPLFWFIILLLSTLLSFYLSDTWSQIELIPGEFNSNGCGAVGLSWLILDPNPNSGLASRLVHVREHFARIISSSSTHRSIQLKLNIRKVLFMQIGS